LYGNRAHDRESSLDESKQDDAPQGHRAREAQDAQNDRLKGEKSLAHEKDGSGRPSFDKESGWNRQQQGRQNEGRPHEAKVEGLVVDSVDEISLRHGLGVRSHRRDQPAQPKPAEDSVAEGGKPHGDGGPGTASHRQGAYLGAREDSWRSFWAC